MKTCLTFLFGLLLGSATPLPAAVVSQAVRLDPVEPPQSGPFGWEDARVRSNLLDCGSWAQYLDLQADGQLLFMTGTLASPYAWFTIAPGERLDAAFVLGNPPFLARGPHSVLSWDVFAPAADGTWLFGWWSTERDFHYDPGPNDCYGWLRLGVSAGKLIIVDDAAEVGGAGIYAGTLIAVPEPAAGTLSVLGLLAATKRRRRFC